MLEALFYLQQSRGISKNKKIKNYFALSSLDNGNVVPVLN
jgi:hypothetical protein